MNTLLETMMKSAVTHMGEELSQKLADGLDVELSTVQRLVTEHLENYQPEINTKKKLSRKRENKKLEPEEICLARVWGGPCWAPML